ncbi:unnamed protein product [Polarella glacialis]|uniref:Protein Mpv17 n=1 Tax=Polarella glacialis TaxID=89957 RepID=A0A813D8L8_POLGL|nr:unnamed protein product [Polarella glacialis]
MGRDDDHFVFNAPSSSGPRQWFAYYRRQLAERPRQTNFVVSYVLSAIGDMSAQLLEAFRATADESPGFDLRRNFSLATCSSLWNSVVLCSWFAMLDRYMPVRTWKTILMKLGASQILLNSIVYVPYFFMLHGILMGQAIDEAWNHLCDKHLEMLTRAWCVFIPGYFLMFAVVPLDYQVLWISVVSLFWTGNGRCYTSCN